MTPSGGYFLALYSIIDECKFSSKTSEMTIKLPSIEEMLCNAVVNIHTYTVVIY